MAHRPAPRRYDARMTTTSPSTVINTPAHPPTGRTAGQAVATGIGGALALMVGTTVARVSAYGAGGLHALLPALASAQLAYWLLGVVVLALLMRRGPAGAFAAIALVLAPLASVAESLTHGGWDQLAATPLALIPIAWRAAGMLGAALVGVIVGVVHRRGREARTTTDLAAPTDDAGSGIARGTEPRQDERTALVIVTISLLVVGSAIAFALPSQWFDVYFHIWGSATVTAGDGTRFLWTAGLALGLLLAALVTAALRRRAGLIVLTSLALVCALIGAFVFQVPQGRFLPEPTVPAYNDDFPVCYGTTGDCPGG